MTREELLRWVDTRAWSLPERLKDWTRASSLTPADVWASCESAHWLNALAVQAIVDGAGVNLGEIYSRSLASRKPADAYRASLPWAMVEGWILEVQR